MNDPVPDRPDKIDDILRLYRLVKITPGLPMPTTHPARAVFDYRHIIHAEDAIAAVTWARAALAGELHVTFAPPRKELAGDGTPRYLLEAHMASGLAVVIVSRVAPEQDGQDADEAAGELVAAA